MSPWSAIPHKTPQQLQWDREYEEGYDSDETAPYVSPGRQDPSLIGEHARAHQPLPCAAVCHNGHPLWLSRSGHNCPTCGACVFAPPRLALQVRQ